MRAGSLRSLARCAGALLPSLLDAQSPRDSAAVASCEGQVVRRVEVTPQRPEFRGHMARWRRVAARVSAGKS